MTNYPVFEVFEFTDHTGRNLGRYVTPNHPLTEKEAKIIKMAIWRAHAAADARRARAELFLIDKQLKELQQKKATLDGRRFPEPMPTPRKFTKPTVKIKWGVFSTNSSCCSAVAEFALGASHDTSLSMLWDADSRREFNKLKTIPVRLARKRAAGWCDRYFAGSWRD